MFRVKFTFLQVSEIPVVHKKSTELPNETRKQGINKAVILNLVNKSAPHNQLKTIEDLLTTKTVQLNF